MLFHVKQKVETGFYEKSLMFHVKHRKPSQNALLGVDIMTLSAFNDLSLALRRIFFTVSRETVAYLRLYLKKSLNKAVGRGFLPAFHKKTGKTMEERVYL